jgi:hypothetical protein
VRSRPDTELVVLAREGSTEAAGALFDRYWVVAWRAAYAVTADRGLVFRETMREAVGIERPPPSTSFGTNVTTLDALGAAPTLNFFTPSAKRRALVVFTDGESQPVSTLATDFAGKPRVDVTFVRVGDTSERIWESGVSEPGYQPDSTAATTLRRPPPRPFAVACSRRGSRPRLPLPSARRSAQARRQSGGSRATVRHSCRTSRCSRSSRSDSSSTGAISRSG